MSWQGKRRRRAKADLIALQENRCHYCGCQMTKRQSPTMATLEHRTPLSRGGDDGRDNLAATCLGCNNRKGNRTEEEYLATVRATVRAAPRPHVPTAAEISREQSKMAQRWGLWRREE